MVNLIATILDNIGYGKERMFNNVQQLANSLAGFIGNDYTIVYANDNEAERKIEICLSGRLQHYIYVAKYRLSDFQKVITEIEIK